MECGWRVAGAAEERRRKEEGEGGEGDAVLLKTRTHHQGSGGKNQNHRILYSMATWGSMPVAPVAAACVRNTMVNGLESFTLKNQTCKSMKYLMVRRRGALSKTLRSRRLFLSVVANRNGKWTCMFALFKRQSLQKAHTNHRILYSTPTWDSVPVAPVADACLRNPMVNGFEHFT